MTSILIETAFVYVDCSKKIFYLSVTDLLNSKLGHLALPVNLGFNIPLAFYDLTNIFDIDGTLKYRGVYCSIGFESLPMPDLKKIYKIVGAKSPWAIIIFFFSFHLSFAHHTSIFCPFFSFFSYFSPFSTLFLLFFPLLLKTVF